MTIGHNQGAPCLELERSLPSEVAAISPFVDKLMPLIRKCGCAAEGESDVVGNSNSSSANRRIVGGASTFSHSKTNSISSNAQADTLDGPRSQSIALA